MKVKERPSKQNKDRSKGRKFAFIATTLVCVLAIAMVITGVVLQRMSMNELGDATASDGSGSKNPLSSLFGSGTSWQLGYVSAESASAEFYDSSGKLVGTVIRGTQVQFATTEDGKVEIVSNGVRGYLQKGASVVSDPTQVIPNHRRYVRTALNFRDENGKLLETFATKGTSVEVIGYDYFEEDGEVHMYKVRLNGEEGYIMPWYLEDTKADSLESYNGDGNFDTHSDRTDRFGGGGAGNLDYFPREKGDFEDNVMPDECRALYVISVNIDNIDLYLEIANQSDINTFVVDITDGKSMGYASDVMRAYSPTAASMAHYTVEEYRAAIQKIKDAGYYVVGRITTFNDTYFVSDNPECAIATTEGEPMRIAGAYWPSAFSRYAWQYKVDLAVEAVQLMGFNEINFDYVRFPDNTVKYEEEGTIDFRNVYNETKAQAVQRFLMYATDILHEQGVYVSADVYGETAYGYVTSYGQYWPAISNVADVICGMPYPDHFGITDGVRPWEHPYETLLSWGGSVMKRQGEISTPAIVRTWVQAYDAIKPPYNPYGPEEVLAEINGLRDAGCTGGYMTWNGTASVTKYRELIPAFTAPDDE
ncbi:MAG: hypothetical protein IJ017_07350 [Oscillospiraceae bacterium]|nr:hypothetical protein [Oscillospiraceae bacterium]